MLIEVICDNCGKRFSRERAEVRRKKNHYCSKKCFKDKTEVEKQTKCLQCSCEIHPASKKQKFCSHSCAASFNNKGKNRHGKIYEDIICLNCGRIFTQKRHKEKCCSKKCFVDNHKSEIIKRFLNGELTDRQVRRDIIKKYIIEKQNGVCSICNSPPVHNEKPLVFIVDHIDGIFTNNNPENIRAICPNCNSQTDTFAGKNVGKNKAKRYNK